jgi:hypothetical protein
MKIQGGKTIMKSLKQWFLVLMATLMVVGVSAGCSSTDTDTEPETEENQTDTDTGTETEDGTEEEAE